MVQTIKKITASLMMLMILCFMASCDKQESNIQLIDDSDSQPEYLNFFSSENLAESDICKYWSDRFAAEYDKLVYINYNGASYYAEEGLSYRELLVKRLQSNTPDDLYIINAEDVMAFEKQGYWMDLSEMKFVDNLSEAALYQSTYQGKVFSVPLYINGFGFFWNVDLLQAHDLTVPENMDQFLAVCAKLKAEGILPYGANKGYALTVPAMCKGMSALYGSADSAQRIAALNHGQPISTYMEEGFSFLKQMITKGYLDPQQALNTAPGEDMKLFLNGECAFICTSLTATFAEPEKITFQTELTGLPVLPDGSIVVYGADLRLCVNPNSAHLETAQKFIEMIGTSDALDASAALDHALSSARNSKNLAIPTHKKMYTLLQQPGQIPNQDFSLHFNTWENIRDVCRALCNNMSIEEACAKLDALQQAELIAYTTAP